MYLHAVCCFRIKRESENPKYVTRKTDLGIEAAMGKIKVLRDFKEKIDLVCEQ